MTRRLTSLILAVSVAACVGSAAARVHLDTPAPANRTAVPVQKRCFLWFCDDDDHEHEHRSGGSVSSSASSNTNTNTNTVSVTVAAPSKPSLPAPHSPSPPPHDTCSAIIVQLKCSCSKPCQADVSYVLAGADSSCVRPYCSNGASTDGETCEARYVLKPDVCVSIAISESDPLFVDGAEHHPVDGEIIELTCPPCDYC